MSPVELERWRSYLLLLARAQLRLDPRQFDASDIVQETLMAAHRQAGQFRGRNDDERVAWLRSLLHGQMVDAWRRLHAQKRDAQRERLLEVALQASSARLEAFLADTGPSPSGSAIRHEEAARLAEALIQLPEAQRQAVELRHVMGCSLEEISRQLDRSPAAVAGLLKRGLHRLREIIQELERS
jgi:RNA polymerase sigma-70 factor (ECF subfamily)